jgi:hypothetical protein
LMRTRPQIGRIRPGESRVTPLTWSKGVFYRAHEGRGEGCRKGGREPLSTDPTRGRD